MRQTTRFWTRWPALLGVVLTGLLLGVAVPARADPVLPSTSGWPLAGPVQVLQGFDPPTQRWGRGHRGVDLAARVGDKVLAAAAGRVSYAGVLAGRGVVVVDHGSVRTTYEPVTALVGVGTEVRVGQPIGRLESGRHCGSVPCLHWGLLRGRTYLDPLTLGPDQTALADPVIRLLPASARVEVERRAAERAAARAAEIAGGVQSIASLGSGGGRHGFARPVSGGITSGFGRRFHPILKVWKLHDGTDFGAPCGAPIRAPYPGVVSRSYTHPAYGHRLFLDHGRIDGRRVVTSYNHAARYVVRVGAPVSRGQVIGYVGSTGYATGCHLHLMLWLDGGLTNPMSWW